jgi:hypothetical protein
MNGTRTASRLVVGVLTALAAPAVQAGTLYVDDDNCPGPGSGSPSDPYCSIQAALDAAVDADEIVVAPGTYYELINMLGKAVTLRSAEGPEVTTIDASLTGGTTVGCWNGEGPDTILQGFTITGAQGSTAFGSGMINNESAPTVIDCTFAANHGLFGGGMWSVKSSPTVINCAFLGNVSDTRGGGMASTDSSPTLVNCTFGDNVATSGRALACNSWDQQGTDQVEMANCILWDGGDEIRNDSGAIIDVRYSLVQGGWPGPGNIDADPSYADPGTGDYRLAPDSPCIDAGDNAAVPEGVAVDLDGHPRFLDVPATPDTGSGDPPLVDMGAYEALGGGCVAIISQEVVCHGNGSTFTVNVEGFSPCTGDTVMTSVTAAGGAVGEDFCTMLIINTAQGGYCCSAQLCVPVPDCSGAALPCDLDGDGVVGVLDFLALLAAWGPNPVHAADFDDDGAVGVTDLLLLLANWS